MKFLDNTGLQYFFTKLKALFATKSELETVRESASKAYHFKGSVNTVADLPANAEQGDVYNIGSSLDGDNYAWTGTAWDKLGGTIDLSSYALDANVVHKTGAETIAGVKTFTSEIDEQRNAAAVVFRNVFTNLTKNTAPSSQFNSLIDLVADKNKTRINAIEAILRTNGDSLTRLYAFNNAGLSSSADLETYNYADGTGVAHAPSTPASDNVHAGDTDVITRDWLPKDTRLVHSTGDETITGSKTFAAGLFGNAVAMTADAIDVSAGTVFTKTITANTTLSFSNVPASPATVCVSLILTNGGAYTVTWPSSVKWNDGSTPDLSTSGVDVLTFLTIDGGTTWYGSVNLLGAA